MIVKCECGGRMERFDDYISCARCGWTCSLEEALETAEEGRMSRKRKKRGVGRGEQAPPKVVEVVLLKRAEKIAEDQLHTIGAWQPAKKQFGKAAQKAVCVECQRAVMILPYGFNQAPVGYRNLPAIAGKAVFEACGGAGGG